MKTILLLLLFASPVLAQTPVVSGGTSVIGAGSPGAGASVTASSVASAISSQSGCNIAGYVWQPSTNTCVAAPSATVTDSSLSGLNPNLGAVTTQKVNNTVVVDPAMSGGNSQITNIVQGRCAVGSGYSATACDLMISPAYAVTEFSRYFTPAKDGNAEQYQLFPTAGGMGRPRFAEDRRLANRYYQSINPLPLTLNSINDRSPFVWETRFSNSSSYADNLAVAQFRIRSYDGQNFNIGDVGMKQNHLILGLNAQIRNAGQGGGTIDNTLSHTAPGDDMVFAIQHDTNGCSEGEDECNKLFRAFLETTTDRWGGTLAATPTVDAAGFGNYTMQVTVNNGYKSDKSGTGVFTVNLSNTYTAGNVTLIVPSPYAGTAMLTGDATANWASRYGASVITALTAPIDARQYTGCPSTGGAVLVTNPFNSDESGVGGRANYCATVASTTGLSAYVNKPVTLFGRQSNLEMAKLVAVIDSTHVIINAGNPHLAGVEYLSAGGAQGYGISMIADDLTSILNYHTSPSTTLHKFFPIVGSDGSGHLFVYTNEAKTAELSTVGYASTTPTRNATISSVSTSGTSVTAVNLSDPGNYQVNRNTLYSTTAQTVLAAPTVTWTGCTTPPTTTQKLVFQLGDPYGYGLKITVTNGGNCSSPAATLSTTWANPYRIAPLVMSKKVLDPVAGSPNNGYLLTGALDPSQWAAGSTVEQPGWIHDYAASQVNYGKYYTGASGNYGIVDGTYYQGDWGGADILKGIANATDGHHYYADATHPIGPGIAYETPPSGEALDGDFSTDFRIYTPPSESFADVGCGGPHGGVMPYHPCVDDIPVAFNLFKFHSTSSEYNLFRYDPTVGGPGNKLLSWDGQFTSAHLSSPDGKFTRAGVGTGGTGTGTGTLPQFLVGGYSGAFLGFQGCGFLLPIGDPSCINFGSIGAIFNGAQSLLDFRLYDYQGNYAGTFLEVRQDGTVTVGGTTACAGVLTFCNNNSSFGSDASGNAVAASLTLASQPSVTCTSANAGRFNYVAGPTGTKDTLEVCLKDASNAYAWRVLY